MNREDFVHLHVHSDYSLIDGAAKVSSLAKAAKKAGHLALALTDHGSLSGSIDFWKACDKEGVKPILGCEAYLAPGLDDQAHVRRGKDEDGKDRIDEKTGRKIAFDYQHFTLLAKNEVGWRNLTKLASIASLEGFYYRPRMSWALLTQYHEGLIALSGCLGGQLAESIKAGREHEALEDARRWKSLFGDDYYVELQPPAVEPQGLVNDVCLKIAKKLSIKCVATADIHYVEPADAAVQEVKICVNAHKTIAENRSSGLNMPPVFYYKSTEEMYSHFRHMPDTLLATREIADKCEKIKVMPGKFFLPKFQTPDGSSSISYFKKLSHEGLARRYGTPTEEQVKRLEYEIACIEKLGFVDYFLITQDFTSWARKNGCPVGPGRGSAAGSLVSYCLGITNIDPLRYGLLFERFLNPDRVSMPDIDIDFCLAGDTKVVEAVTGEVLTLKELYAKKARPAVFAVGSDYKIRQRSSEGVAHKGVKQVFRLLTKGGRSVTATGDHRFLSGRGWVKLRDLKVGDAIATAKSTPVETGSTAMPRHELILLAGILSEGGTTASPTITLTQKTVGQPGSAIMDEYEEAAKAFEKTFTKRYVQNGVTKLTINSGSDWRRLKSERPPAEVRVLSVPVGTTLREAERLLVLATVDVFGGDKRKAAKALGASWAGVYSRITKEDQQAARMKPLRCGAFVWAESLGLTGTPSHAKRVPPVVFKLSNEQLAFFLGRLWSGDGCLVHGSSDRPIYSTSSPELAEQVRTLLLRLGITSSIYSGQEYETTTGRRFRCQVGVVGRSSVSRFCQVILPHVLASAQHKESLLKAGAVDCNRGEALSDPVPAEAVRPLVEEGMAKRGWSRQKLGRESGINPARFAGSSKNYARSVVASLGSALRSPSLSVLGTSDVYWDNVKAIEDAGQAEVFDVVDVDCDRNFVLANGLVSHNCERNRWKVIEYVRNKYGEKCVAQIVTFGESKAKSAVRDVARVLDVKPFQTNVLAKMIPEGPKVELQDAIETVPELQKAYKANPSVKKIFDLALGLEGLYRSAGRHAAGIVIGDTDLVERIPLMKVGSGEEAGVCTAFTMEQVEEVGLLKMDFLGLRTITVIYDAVRLIEKTTGKWIDPDDIPVRDNHSMETTAGKHRCKVHEVAFEVCRCCDKTLEIFARAETGGVFQVESTGMRKLLLQMKPDRFDDLVAMVALFRPGPLGSGMDQTYVRRKHGVEDVEYEHPVMEKITKNTYGVWCYQEQLMQLSVALAGFTLPEADTLRKATGKKKPEVMEKLKDKFVSGCQKTSGLDVAKASEIWSAIVKFADYSFNASHSAAYALISWQTAWLKANYPVEFMAATLTSWTSDTVKLAGYVDELRRMGVPIAPPDLNVSGSGFSVAQEGSIRTNYVIYGLDAVKGVGQDAVQHILAARERSGGFQSVVKFCEEVDLQTVTKGMIESFAKAGAFRSTGVNRAQLLEPREVEIGSGKKKKFLTETGIESVVNSTKAAKKKREPNQFDLFSGLVDEEVELEYVSSLIPTLPEWPKDRILEAERESIGFYLSGHPLDKYAETLQKYSSIQSARVIEIMKSNDPSGVVGGVVRGVRVIQDSTGKDMAFVTIEDYSGFVDGVVFAYLWEKLKESIIPGRVMFFRGTLDAGREQPSLKIDGAIPFEDADRLLSEANSFNVYLWKGKATQPEIDRAQRIIRTHRGNKRIFFSWILFDGKKTPLEPSPYLVSGTDLFRRELARSFEKGHASIFVRK